MARLTFPDKDIKSIINKFSLHFSKKEIEGKFKQEYFDKSIKNFRASFLLVTIFYAVFGLLDLISSEEFVREFYIIRYLIVTPVLLFIFFFSYHKNFIRYWQKLLVLAFITSGTGIIYMLHRNTENVYYYGGMFLIFIAGYFLIKLRFYGAVFSGVLLILIFNIGGLFTNSLDSEYLTYLLLMNSFYIGANIIAALAIYNIEHLERSDFYQRFLLSEKQKEITQINASLEQQVQERTQLLEIKNTNLKKEIEHRKLIENELIKAKEKAEESDKLKSSFLANMSHEIRTPMNGIIGFIGLLKDLSISENQRIEFLNLVEKSSDRLLNTINDLLEISKIEAGQIPISSTIINLNDILDDNYSFFLMEAHEKNIELKKPLINDTFLIRSDELKINSILSNLIKNAIKFTKTGYVEFGYEIQDNLILFHVKDTGVGVPPNRIDAIFNRFEQADLSNSRGYEGSGLGLSIAKAYTEMLGGKIWVESTLNKGSIFYFTIELIKTTENLNENDPQKTIIKMNSTSKKHKILLVDDDSISLNFLEAILSQNDYILITANNGKETLEIFNSTPDIDLILIDLKMPLLDGFKTTVEIRKTNKTIPIIAQTAYALVGDKEKAIEVGCTDYITKPIDRIALNEKIRKYLE